MGLNPHDWAALDIAILAATFNGPVVGRTFWGLTPVPMPTLASGTAYVGDFATGMTYFDRNVTNVFASDSHADLFLRNQLAILAKTRALLVVTEPAALVKAEGPSPLMAYATVEEVAHGLRLSRPTEDDRAALELHRGGPGRDRRVDGRAAGTGRGGLERVRSRLG